MSKSTRGIRVAGVASLAVTLSIGVAAPAIAAAGFEFSRLAGDDRYETAVEASEQYGASDDVIIANGQPGEYADALAGNYLAGAEDAPILLTKRSGLPDVTKDRLATIDPTNVWIVGGTAAVPAEQEAELEAAGYNVERLAGDDRFGTNAEVIAADGDSKGGVGLIATGLNFPDALAAGPFAYQGHSLGLVRTNSVPDVVGDALEADGVTKVLIFGGEGAVGAGVVSDLAARGITVEERFAGSDRSETSELAAEWALENLDFTDEHVGVASGYTDGFGADALAGGPVEGNENSPMLITRNVDNPDDVLDYLEAHSDTLGDGHIYGGTAAISQAAEDAMTEAATGTGANQDFAVTQGAATNTVSSSDTTNEGARQYQVTGLDNTKTYDVELFPSENVTVSNSGAVTFADTDNDNQADKGDANAVVADIEVVNGAAQTDGAERVEVQPVNGTITFTVDSEAPDSVVPVVYLDEGLTGLNQVNLDANNQPTEMFGIGGTKTWNPAESTTRTLGADENITSVDKAADTIVTATALYEYDANDRFYIESTTDDSNNSADAAEEVTLAEFEAQLSAGDQLSQGTFYQANEALSSSFLLEDLAPAAPGASTTADLTKDTSVAFTVTGIASGATVTVYGGPNDNNAFNKATDTQRGQTTTDQDPNTSGFQVIATGLTPNTAYDFFVTQTVSGEESAPSTRQDVTTDPASDPAIITDAKVVTDAPIEGRVGTNDQYTLVFDEAMDPATVDGALIDVTDPDGDSVRIRCNTAAPTPGTDFVTDALCSLGAGSDATVSNDTLTITLAENAEDRNADGNSTPAAVNISYPLTIQNTDVLKDLGGEEPNVAASTDKVIDKEA